MTYTVPNVGTWSHCSDCTLCMIPGWRLIFTRIDTASFAPLTVITSTALLSSVLQYPVPALRPVGVLLSVVDHRLSVLR